MRCEGRKVVVWEGTRCQCGEGVKCEERVVWR